MRIVQIAYKLSWKVARLIIWNEWYLSDYILGLFQNFKAHLKTLLNFARYKSILIYYIIIMFIY